MVAFPDRSVLIEKILLTAAGLGLALVPFLAVRTHSCPIQIGMLEKIQPFSTMGFVGSASRAQICNFENLFYLYSLVVIVLVPLLWKPRDYDSIYGRYLKWRRRAPMALKTRFYILVTCVSLAFLEFLLLNWLGVSPKDPFVLSRKSLFWTGVVFCGWSLAVAYAVSAGLKLRRERAGPSNG